MFNKIIMIIMILLSCFFFFQCDFPTAEKINKPALVRIWLTYELGENSVFEKLVTENDSLKIKCTNFRLFNDSLYTKFYQDKSMFKQNGDSVKTINILDGNFDTIKIAEGIVPAYDYNILKFQMTPLDTAFVIGGIKYPLDYWGDGAETFVEINEVISHEPDKTTDIYITYFVNKGIRRIGDKFFFSTVGDDSTAISFVIINEN